MNTLTTSKPRGFIESALALLLLLMLLFGLLRVLSVFFGVFTYAIIFSVALAQPFESLVNMLNKKRKLAAFIYALLLIALVAMPFIYIISALTGYAIQAEQFIVEAKTSGVPPLPAWIAGLPFAGVKIESFWLQLQADPSGTISTYEPQIRATLSKLISGGAGLVGAALEFVVGIIISAILLTSSAKILQPIYRIMENIVGSKGPVLVVTTGRAVKGVAVGVMGTAFIAALAAWIGFAIAGISFAAGLAAVTFFLVVIQVGPILVFVPVAIWLFMTGHSGMGIFVSVYTLAVMIPIDNILKPILIAKSGKLPVLVLFLGVIGGMVTWGFTGMFKGAIILAVFYTIITSWLGTKQPEVQPAIIEPELS
jgi:predicted PurR-regulated permease PerM